MKLVEGEAPMFESLEISKMARALASYSGARLGVIAQNVANADTPGYKAQDLPDFETTWREAGGEGMKATRPGHLHGGGEAAAPMPIRLGGQASPDGNTVSLQSEMLRAAQVRQDHEMALAVSKNTSSITRAALGLR
jgi:flagellar basal-body rod protein FlgB